MTGNLFTASPKDQKDSHAIEAQSEIIAEDLKTAYMGADVNKKMETNSTVNKRVRSRGRTYACVCVKFVLYDVYMHAYV